MASIATGAILNALQVPRPEIFRTVNAAFIPLGTGMLLVSIGLSMRFKRVKKYVRECVAVGAIKFLVVPGNHRDRGVFNRL